jgi:hypothetical protein
MSRVFLFKLVAIFLGVSASLFAAEVFLRAQDFIELDGFAKTKPWNSLLHHGDDKFVVTSYGTDCADGTTKILLLGDSWMEDPVLSGTIGHELSLGTGRCIKTINGGTSSYSPTIYLLRARQAYQKFGTFDYAIVNIDETDIGDEWLRYRIPLERNMSGKIVAVPFERDIRSQFIWNGKLWAEDSPFYLIRLLKFALFYNILVPYMELFTVAPNHYGTLMQYVFAPETVSSFASEKKYFYERLVEMLVEVSGVANGAGSVYVTHHPHLRGLITDIEDGKRYLPVVSEAIAKLERDTGARILDARNHVKQIHGEEFLLNTFERDDPFSHLAGQGATRYGKWIAGQISQKENGFAE